MVIVCTPGGHPLDSIARTLARFRETSSSEPINRSRAVASGISSIVSIGYGPVVARATTTRLELHIGTIGQDRNAVPPPTTEDIDVETAGEKRSEVVVVVLAEHDGLQGAPEIDLDR